MCIELFLLPKPHVKIWWPQLLLFVYLILWIGREAQFFKMVLIFCIFHNTLFSSKTSKAFSLFWKNGLFLLIYIPKLSMYHPIFFPGGKWASRESFGLPELALFPFWETAEVRISLCSVCPLYSLATPTPLGWFKGPALRLGEWLVRKISSVFFKMAYVKGQSSENTFFMHLKIIAYLLLNICSYSLLEKKLYYDIQWSFS